MSMNRNDELAKRYLKPPQKAVSTFFDSPDGGLRWVGFPTIALVLSELWSSFFLPHWIDVVYPFIVFGLLGIIFIVLLFTSEKFLTYYMRVSEQYPEPQDKNKCEHLLKTYYKNIADIDAEMKKVAPEEWAIIGDWHPPDWEEPKLKNISSDYAPSAIASSDFGRAQWQKDIIKREILNLVDKGLVDGKTTLDAHTQEQLVVDNVKTFIGPSHIGSFGISMNDLAVGMSAATGTNKQSNRLAPAFFGELLPPKSIKSYFVDLWSSHEFPHKINLQTLDYLLSLYRQYISMCAYKQYDEKRIAPSAKIIADYIEYWQQIAKKDLSVHVDYSDVYKYK